MRIVVLRCLAVLFGTTACQALEPTTKPTTMQTSLAISHTQNVWTATITWTNPTDHGLSLGRFLSYSLIRTDVNPTITAAASPTGTMAPHFRVLLPAHASKTSTMTIYDASAPLPPGKYHLSITYPHDILPDPLEIDFTNPLTPSATTAPTAP
jgi:hypothetical protein